MSQSPALSCWEHEGVCPPNFGPLAQTLTPAPVKYHLQPSRFPGDLPAELLFFSLLLNAFPSSFHPALPTTALLHAGQPSIYLASQFKMASRITPQSLRYPDFPWDSIGGRLFD